MDRIKLGNRIKTERTKQNISQKELAKMIGIDPTVYSRMERGERDLSIENLIDISNALHVRTDYFLFNTHETVTEMPFNGLLKQTYKLSKQQQELLFRIITILLENSDKWVLPEKGHTAKAVFSENDKVVNYKEIGSRIRMERTKQNLTQEKLSELAGISENFLGNIERAAAIPSLESLFKIANALNLPIIRLFINANDKNVSSGLYDAITTLEQSGEKKNAVLLNILAVLIDNSGQW